MGVSSVESGGGGMSVVVVVEDWEGVGVGIGGGVRNLVANAEAQSYTFRRYRDSMGGRPSWEER